MKKVLVIFSGTRDNTDILKKVIEIEGKDIFLKIVFIISEAIPSNFSTWLMYMGFLGEEPTEEIKNLILREIEKDFEEKKEEIENFLLRNNFNFKVELIKGNFEFLVRNLFKEGFDAVYTSKSKKVILGEEKLEKDLNIIEI